MYMTGQVVSTVASGVFFAHFPTVECVSTISSFLLMSLTVQAGKERESAALKVGC